MAQETAVCPDGSSALIETSVGTAGSTFVSPNSQDVITDKITAKLSIFIDKYFLMIYLFSKSESNVKIDTITFSIRVIEVIIPEYVTGVPGEVGLRINARVVRDQE